MTTQMTLTKQPPVPTPQLKTPSKSTNKVWLYFRQYSVNGVVNYKKAHCTVCKNDVSYHNSTTNLLQHLIVHHPPIAREITGNGENQLTLGTKKLSKNEKKKIDNALALMIARDMQPISIVENEGFKNLINALNPGI